MAGSPARGWAWAAIVALFFLMTMGNIVSATGSGLGCPDWPLCHGRLLPPAQAEVLIEFSHRLKAIPFTALLLVTVILTWRRTRARSPRRLSLILLGLLVVQIALGAVTVLLKLPDLVSTAHLVNALLILGGLVLHAEGQRTCRGAGQAAPPRHGRALRPLGSARPRRLRPPCGRRARLPGFSALQRKRAATSLGECRALAASLARRRPPGTLRPRRSGGATHGAVRCRAAPPRLGLPSGVARHRGRGHRPRHPRARRARRHRLRAVGHPRLALRTRGMLEQGGARRSQRGHARGEDGPCLGRRAPSLAPWERPGSWSGRAHTPSSRSSASCSSSSSPQRQASCFARRSAPISRGRTVWSC